MSKVSLRDLYNPTPFCGQIDCDLEYLPGMLAHDNVNLSPSYQRRSVWTQEQREAFMGHFITGGEMLPVIFQRVPDSGHSEVLDGKQRIEAMLAWINNEVGARLPDGRLVFRRDIEEKRLGRVSFRIKYINLPFEERKRFYVRLNSAGTPHTKEELEAALKATPDSTHARL
jgi:hypothetical protein